MLIYSKKGYPLSFHLNRSAWPKSLLKKKRRGEGQERLVLSVQRSGEKHYTGKEHGRSEFVT